MSEVNINKEQILDIVKTISNSSVKNKHAHFKKIYSSFHTRFPHLFEMACSPNMDVDTLEYMLGMMDRIKNNETNQDQASVQVGEELFKRFVNPNLTPVEPGAEPKETKGPVFNITTVKD